MATGDSYESLSYRPRMCYGYAAVASRRLWLSTVFYGHLRSTTEDAKIFFADSCCSTSLFLFQLVSSFRKCPYGLETTCFDGTLRCGI